MRVRMNSARSGRIGERMLARGFELGHEEQDPLQRLQGAADDAGGDGKRPPWTELCGLGQPQLASQQAPLPRR